MDNEKPDHFRELAKERLKQLKLRAIGKGLTDQDIADRTGFQPSHIDRWFKGKVIPNLDTFLKLADAIEKGLEF